MKSIDSQVYFLGYEGYGIYNLADNTLRLMPITFRGQHIEPPEDRELPTWFTRDYYGKTFSDFSGQNNPYSRIYWNLQIEELIIMGTFTIQVMSHPSLT